MCKSVAGDMHATVFNSIIRWTGQTITRNRTQNMRGMEGVVSGLKFCVCSLSPAGAIGIKFFLHLWCSVTFPRRLLQTPRVWVRPTERLTTHFRFPFVSFLFFSYAGRLAFRFLLALLFVCFWKSKKMSDCFDHNYFLPAQLVGGFYPHWAT